MKSKEEEDDSYAEDFDNLDDEKNPIIVKDRDSSKRKRSLVGKVTHEMYKVFDEACKDINITTGVIQISDNARKSKDFKFTVNLSAIGREINKAANATARAIDDMVEATQVRSVYLSFLKGLEKAANDIGRELSRGMASAEKEINKAYNSVRTSPLLLKSLKKAGDQIGKDISRGVNAASKEINRAVHGAVVVDNFRTGNQLQLVSRASGRALQIVTSQNGQIIPDGNGMEGPQAANAVWIVTDLKNNIVTLHNKNNFLCIVGGQTCLRYFPDTNQAGREAHFRVVQVQNNFVCLESIIEPGRHVGVHNNGAYYSSGECVRTFGQLKSAVATGREIEGQFRVRLIYSPYPPNPDSQHAKAATYQAPPPSYPGYVVAPPGAAAASGQTTVTQGSGVTVVQTTYPPAGPPPYKK